MLFASIYFCSCYHETISVLCLFLAVPFVILSSVVVAVPGIEFIKLSTVSNSKLRALIG